MPIFDVEANGERFQIEAPDEASAVSALASLPAAPVPENSLSGSAKALGIGAAEGVIGLAGLPGDAADLASRGFDYMTGKTTNETVGPYAKKIGSENIKKLVESYTGEFRKPQTVTEKYLQTTGAFLPAAIGGPAGALGRVATRAIIPGVASEAAGQLTEGTTAEPYARIAGALGGAIAGGKIASAVSKPKVAPVPTAEDVAASKSALYSNPAIADVRYNPAIISKVVDRAATLGKSQYMDAPAVYKTLEAMKTPMNGPTHSILDIENGRRRLQEIKMTASTSKTERAAATLASDYIDNVLPHLGKVKGAVVAGDTAAASAALRTARNTAAVEFRNQKIVDLLERVKNTAVATHSGGNLENEIYKQVRTMLEPKNIKRNLAGWTQEEISALRAVLPNLGARVLRRTGKLLGGGGGLGQMITGGAGAATFGWPGAFALPALGMGANKLGSSMAVSRLNKVGEMLRTRAPVYGKANRDAYIQSQLGGGILGSLPSKQQAALLTLLAARPQPSN